MVTELDTLYLTADTLVSIDNKIPGKKKLLAYGNVRIFKSNLQAVTDSLEYNVADSTMFFYGNPILWTDGNQLTADSINMVIRKKAIESLNMKNKAFVITQDSSLNYNQIKGRNMVARFTDNELRVVNVFGNGESVFFMYDEETYALLGMNKIICSDITLIFENQVLKDASFLVNPEGQFIPPHELKDPDRYLQGFAWHGELRPVLDDFVRPVIAFEQTTNEALIGQSLDLEIKTTLSKPTDGKSKKKKPKKGPKKSRKKN